MEGDTILNISDLGRLANVAPALLDAVTRLVEQLAALNEPSPKASARKFLTIGQAAEELNLSEKSVRRLIERGLIHASKGTRLIRVPTEEIEAYKRRSVL